MPATTLDPVTALVVIDLQKGIVGPPMAHPVEQVVGNTVALADAFRARDLPVVLVNVAGGPGVRTDRSAAMAAAAGTGAGAGAAGAAAGPREFPADFAELLPELGAGDADILVTKRAVSAFAGTDLEARLRERGVTQIVLTGVATSAGVESTARAASDLGFHVTVATDACSDRSPVEHDFSATTALTRFAETGTTAEVLALLPELTR